MDTCDTCKHFGDPSIDASDRTYAPAGFHVCKRIEQVATVDGEQPTDDQLAVVVDAEGYYAALCVTGAFGCNQWTTKHGT